MGGLGDIIDGDTRSVDDGQRRGPRDCAHGIGWDHRQPQRESSTLRHRLLHKLWTSFWDESGMEWTVTPHRPSRSRSRDQFAFARRCVVHHAIHHHRQHQRFFSATSIWTTFQNSTWLHLAARQSVATGRGFVTPGSRLLLPGRSIERIRRPARHSMIEYYAQATGGEAHCLRAERVTFIQLL